MRPRWLGGWRLWGDVRPTGPDGDQRPLMQRLMVLIGLRRDW